VMTPGLKRSLAARAVARSSGRSSSEQRISCSAASREIGTPGRTLARAEAHAERLPEVTGVMEVTAT